MKILKQKLISNDLFFYGFYNTQKKELNNEKNLMT